MRFLFLLVAICLIIPAGVVAHGNLSVYSYGDDYIIWNVGGNTLVWIDGIETAVSGLTYGQYDLTPGSEHIGCNIDGNCTGIATKDNAMSVFMYWGVYFILIVLCIVSFYIPITVFPAFVYSTYLMVDYLPSIEASFNEYSLVGVLLVASVLAGMAGWRRL